MVGLRFEKAFDDCCYYCYCNSSEQWHPQFLDLVRATLDEMHRWVTVVVILGLGQSRIVVAVELVVIEKRMDHQAQQLERDGSGLPVGH
jgi:hypothetical protein